MLDELEIEFIKPDPDMEDACASYLEERDRIMRQLCEGLGIPPEVLYARPNE